MTDTDSSAVAAPTFDAALALHRKGEAVAAEAAYRALLAVEPDQADALNNLALLRKQAGDKREAEAFYRRSLDIRPANPEVLSNLGVLLLENGRLNEAEAALRDALAQRAGYAEAWNNLGNVLQGQRRFDDALAAYSEILRHAPPRLQQLAEGAQQAQAAGKAEEARAAARQARGIRSTLVESCWNLSLLHLLLGRYAEGWPLHEARYDQGRFRPVPLPPKLPCPQWRGEPLAGKAILIWFEQGMGDEIHFVRYIPWLKAQGASRVTLVCKAPLLELLKTVDGVDEVFAAEGQLVLPAQDFWVLPMSLALHHKTTLDNIPASLPYLKALPERIDYWRDKLPKRGKRTTRVVGLVWAGSATHRNDANRSLPSVEVLAPLAKVTGTAFVSLQKGEREDEAKNPPAGLTLMPLGGLIRDFADTAAIVSQLDLVITVDTAVAHVAGALGIPCWVMLPWLGVDWRWQLEGDSSPWYPQALRLFRQTTAGDWSTVVNNMVTTLNRKPAASTAKAAKAPAGKKKK